MPQLSQIGEIYASQLFWLAIVFALIYFGIGRGMVPKIEKTIEDRTTRISGDIAAAEAARDAARSMEEVYENSLTGARADAARLNAEAKAKATADAEVRLKAASADIDARIDAALAGIDAASKQALNEIEGTTVDVVEAIIARLSGATVDRATIETKVKAILAHG